MATTTALNKIFLGHSPLRQAFLTAFFLVSTCSIANGQVITIKG